MLGLPERSIIMSHEQAIEYVALKVEDLKMQINKKEEELFCLNCELDNELEKLHMLKNPPVRRL